MWLLVHTALLTVMLLVFTWLQGAQGSLREIVGITPCLILLGKLYNARWGEVGEQCVEELCSAVGQAMDAAPEFRNTMPLSLEHDGLGRCCSPVTASWTMKPQHPGTWSQYGRRSSPLQLHPYHMCCQQHHSCSGEAEDGDVLHLEPTAPLS